MQQRWRVVLGTVYLSALVYLWGSQDLPSSASFLCLPSAQLDDGPVPARSRWLSAAFMLKCEQSNLEASAEEAYA